MPPRSDDTAGPAPDTVLMLHDLQPAYFDLPLKSYRLTFDDGLYSHYYYAPLLQKMDTGGVFFVATAFIKPGSRRTRFDGRHLKPVKSRSYMYDAFVRGRFEDFMTVDEVCFLAAMDGMHLGAHSHWHDVIITPGAPKKPLSRWKRERCPHLPVTEPQKWNVRSKLAFRGFDYHDGRMIARSHEAWLDYIKYDTEACLNWFQQHIGRTPTDYSLPFNEYNPTLLEVLKSFGFQTFYNGKSSRTVEIIPRLDIDRMISRGDQLKGTSPSR